jgi:fatty-acyl-CoA synthase
MDLPNGARWLGTGDLGYLIDGQIVICGRRNDSSSWAAATSTRPISSGRRRPSRAVRAGNAVAVRIDAGQPS